MALGDHGVGLLLHRWCPARRFPAGGGNAITQSARHHEHKVNQGHDDEGLPYTDFKVSSENFHQFGSQGRADHGATTKAHDGHACGHATAVGEPFDQGTDRRDVAQAQTNAANKARAQQHHPKLVIVNTRRRNEHAAAPAQGTDHTCSARAHTL